MGIVTSVLPLELMLLFVPPVLIAYPLIRLSLWRDAFDKRIDVVLPLVALVMTIAICAELPFKYVDLHRVELTADCTTIGELKHALRLRTEQTELDAKTVCFTERSPTLRTVRDELERQTNTTLQLGYCGNGASFLFGAYPLHKEIVAVK